MLLFLDVISPIPEFCVIDDNKILLQQKITQSETDKLSDNIIQSYIEIDKRLNLTKNLKKVSLSLEVKPFCFNSFSAKRWLEFA